MRPSRDLTTLHKRPRRTKNNPERGRLTDVQKRENAEISKTRVIVENTNRRLKMYKVLGTKLRHYRAGAAQQQDKGITAPHRTGGGASDKPLHPALPPSINRLGSREGDR
jgi:hypothetical protein